MTGAEGRDTCCHGSWTHSADIGTPSSVSLWSIFYPPHPLPLSLSRRRLAEALGMLKDADEMGVAIGPASYDHLLRALLAQGSIEDAMAVKAL